MAYTGKVLVGIGESYSETVPDSDSSANGMHTVLHELGHNFQMTDREASDEHANSDYDVHNVGGSRVVNSGLTTTATAITPLADRSGGVNECGCPVDERERFEMTWSSCSISYWGDSA